MRKCYDNFDEDYMRGYRDGKRKILESSGIKITDKEEAETRLKSAGNLNGLCYIQEKKDSIFLIYYHHNRFGMSVEFVINLSKGEVEFDEYKVDKGVYFYGAENLRYQIRDLADLLRDAENDLEKLVRAKMISFN